MDAVKKDLLFQKLFVLDVAEDITEHAVAFNLRKRKKRKRLVPKLDENRKCTKAMIKCSTVQRSSRRKRKKRKPLSNGEALIHTAQYGAIGIENKIKFLLKKESLSLNPRFGMTALQSCCRRKKPNAVKALLETPWLLLNLRTDNYNTPLFESLKGITHRNAPQVVKIVDLLVNGPRKTARRKFGRFINGLKSKSILPPVILAIVVDMIGGLPDHIDLSVTISPTSDVTALNLVSKLVAKNSVGTDLGVHLRKIKRLLVRAGRDSQNY